MQPLHFLMSFFVKLARLLATRLTETSLDADRRELERHLAGSSSIQELEARERQWTRRNQRQNSFYPQ